RFLPGRALEPWSTSASTNFSKLKAAALVIIREDELNQSLTFCLILASCCRPCSVDAMNSPYALMTASEVSANISFGIMNQAFVGSSSSDQTIALEWESALQKFRIPERSFL